MSWVLRVLPAVPVLVRLPDARRLPLNAQVRPTLPPEAQRAALVNFEETVWPDHRRARGLKRLQREVVELKRANEILMKASTYFAQAELDRRGK